MVREPPSKGCSMLSPKVLRKEHQKAVTEMATLVREAGDKGNVEPIGHDWALYERLALMKDMLEWVHSSLIKRDLKRGVLDQLIGDSKYYAMGPVDTETNEAQVGVFNAGCPILPFFFAEG